MAAGARFCTLGHIKSEAQANHVVYRSGTHIAADMYHTAKIIIVDDEPLIAMMLEDQLADLGYEVAGSAYSEAQAFDLLEKSEATTAILDVHLGAETSFAFATACQNQGMTIIFTTGDDHAWLSEKCQDVPILSKPFSRDDLIEALEQAKIPG